MNELIEKLELLLEAAVRHAKENGIFMFWKMYRSDYAQGVRADPERVIRVAVAWWPHEEKDGVALYRFPVDDVPGHRLTLQEVNRLTPSQNPLQYVFSDWAEKPLSGPIAR